MSHTMAKPDTRGNAWLEPVVEEYLPDPFHGNAVALAFARQQTWTVDTQSRLTPLIEPIQW
jgi:hypothetical protein